MAYRFHATVTAKNSVASFSIAFELLRPQALSCHLSRGSWYHDICRPAYWKAAS